MADNTAQRPPEDPLASTATAGYDAIQGLIAERNKLRDENAKLRAALRDATNDNKKYLDEVAEQRHRADHYERFSIEIVTQMNTVRMVVDDATRRATNVAYQREEPTKQVAAEDLSEEDQVRMNELARQLAPRTELPEA